MENHLYLPQKVAYEVEGEGRPIVLLHGFCEDRSVWETLKAGLREASCQVVSIDLPGFGGSEAVPGISIAQMAETAQAVLSELGISRCILIGHSMGGYVSLAFARQFPDQLLGLGLFHSHPYADAEEKKASRQKSADFIRRQGHALFVKQLIPSLFAPKFARDNAMLIHQLSYQAARYPSEGIIAALEAMAQRPDESTTLAQLAVPALFIVGKEDTAIPAEQSLAQLHLPARASIHLLENVGHMGMLEASTKTLAILREFVEFCHQQNPAR
jgi:pimeloyl-ACP methyl ester carboxylesterase